MAAENSGNGSSREQGSRGLPPRERENGKPLSVPEQYFPLDVISSSTGTFLSDASLALIATKWNFARFRGLSREMRERAAFNRFKSNCFP